MIGIRPQFAEIWSVNQPRTLQIVLPPQTRLELAQRAVAEQVQAWTEALDVKQHLVLVSDVEISGPHLYPFLDHYGDDLWLATAKFRSTRPRQVKEDLVMATQELEDELADIEVTGADGQTQHLGAVKTNPSPASLPDDYREQLQHVEDNADRVYDELREQERQAGEVEEEMSVEDMIRRARHERDTE